MDLPISPPHHCCNCEDIRPHHPNSLTCLYCESVIPQNYFPYESSGRIEVDLRRRGRSSNMAWAFLACDRDIVRYYSWFLEQEGLNLKPNYIHPHISFIRSEIPRSRSEFSLLEGIVNFRYSNILRSNGFHFWIDVHCPEVYSIRRKYGVSDDKRLSLHMTIGRKFKDDIDRWGENQYNVI